MVGLCFMSLLAGVTQRAIAMSFAFQVLNTKAIFRLSTCGYSGMLPSSK
jgi:hypothetical protein